MIYQLHITNMQIYMPHLRQVYHPISDQTSNRKDRIGYIYKYVIDLVFHQEFVSLLPINLALCVYAAPQSSTRTFFYTFLGLVWYKLLTPIHWSHKIISKNIHIQTLYTHRQTHRQMHTDRHTDRQTASQQ